jgi:hypothetical protein
LGSLNGRENTKMRVQILSICGENRDLQLIAISQNKMAEI